MNSKLIFSHIANACKLTLTGLLFHYIIKFKQEPNQKLLLTASELLHVVVAVADVVVPVLLLILIVIN